MAEPRFPEATENQIKEGKSLAWLAYFGILFLIPLLAHKDNPFSKYHVRQGIVLYIATLALIIILLMVGVVFNTITKSISAPGAGAICTFLGWFLTITLLVVIGFAGGGFAIFGIIKSASGQFWKVPLLGNIAEKWYYKSKVSST